MLTHKYMYSFEKLKKNEDQDTGLEDDFLSQT